MTSQINASAIDETYPIAGQDNDTQGFRDNFSATQSALLVAKNEITDLQARSVVVADTNNDPAVNNLLGSTLRNGILRQMYPAVPSENNGFIAVTDITHIIDVSQGPLQKFEIGVNAVTLTFVSWPATRQYAKIRIHLLSNGEISSAPTLSAGVNSTIKYETGFPSLTLSIDQKHKVIEAWSDDAGLTVYIRYIGEF